MILVTEKSKDFASGKKTVEKTVFNTLTAATEYVFAWVEMREKQDGACVTYQSKQKHGACVWIGFFAQRSNGDQEEIMIESVWKGDPV